tara:strand:- start:5174 stop:5983 length:810 start_codon:yes stop_codon:yes gene_type:complete
LTNQVTVYKVGVLILDLHYGLEALMENRPSIDQIKQKIRDEREAAYAAESAEEELAKKEASGPPKRAASPEVLEQMASYAAAAAELNTEIVEKVDIGATPDGVDLLEDEDPDDDNMFYRGTAVDNPVTRRAIEAKCSEMDFADLIITGRVSQVIPMVDEKLVVVFRSLLANENFWIEKNAQEHATTDWAMRSWMGYARLTMSVESLNGKEFSPYVDTSGQVDKVMFAKSFQQVMGMGEKLIELLLINLNWFNDRVENLYKHDFEKLKNG